MVTENPEFGIRKNEGLHVGVRKRQNNVKAARRHPEGPTERRATSGSLWGDFRRNPVRLPVRGKKSKRQEGNMDILIQNKGFPKEIKTFSSKAKIS